ncbi:MAG: glucose-6-phosphate dehydrogenase, partial [Pseudomonadota bacterium]
MTAQFLPVDPFDLIVMGGTGDLALRKLLPGMLHRDADDQLPPASRIIGLARGELDGDGYRRLARDAIAKHVGDRVDDVVVERFLGRLHYVRLDAAGDEGWGELGALCADYEEQVRVLYLATSPALFGTVCHRFSEAGLATAATRVVLEKPIGTDLVSAQATNTAVAEVFDEAQTFRIDHYLGKETVQNLITLRFGNSLFEPVWSAATIDHVQITVAETLGVGSRGGYYDRSGALRDMVQNHILQLLCLVAMEPPSALDADAVRDEKLKVLRALRPIGPAEVGQKTVRGQYTAGAVDGTAVRGYVDELGHASNTETFAMIKAEVDNWRWAGVPFYLRTGKRLAARQSEIAIQFRCIPHSIFGDASHGLQPNRMLLRLQPDEGVKLFMTVKDPGPGGLRLKSVPLNLSYAETFTVRYPDAYERLLLDVVRGNQTLFMRADEVDAAWRWIDPIAAGRAPATGVIGLRRRTACGPA